MVTVNEIKAQLLLDKCIGDEIWSFQRCIDEGLPASWIDELQDIFESGFDCDSNTIYVDDQLTNQYQGVADLKIAYKCAEFLGVDWKTATQFAVGRAAPSPCLEGSFRRVVNVVLGAASGGTASGGPHQAGNINHLSLN